MKKNSAVTLAVVLVLTAMLIASTNLTLPVEASRALGPAVSDGALQRARHGGLKSRLASTSVDEFQEALDALAALDEPGALDVWQAALNNPDQQLRQKAWSKYKQVWPQLSRKELVPQVARVFASKSEVLQTANSIGVDAYIWSSDDNEAIVAAPPYLVERLRREGISLTVLYESIAEWQQARATGDLLARSITPDYQSDLALSGSEIRIAVIDLAKRTEPLAGYSDWLGDRENILMRNDSFIAYLDIFSSDGTSLSVARRIQEQYTRRGYRLAGFYTPAEFSELVHRFFPGESFDAGRSAQAQQEDGIRTALADGKYHSYEEALSEFTQLAGQYSDIARMVELGRSFEGRQIFALKINKDPAVSDSSKPDLLITGGHHAREWISVEPPIYFANQLLKSYATDDSIKYLVDNLQIWIVPILNPDGLTYSQGSPNDRMDSVRLWRKNRRPISLDGCGSSVGVDLNRNYSFQWRLVGDEPCPVKTDDLGASDDPESEIYRGPRPESEPEVRAIKSLIDDPNRRFRAQLDYHNFSQLILYPWGYQPQAAPDAGNLATLAERISAEILKVNRKLYRPRQAVDLYATTGSFSDYAYGVNRVPAPFTIEMRPVSTGFDVPESEIPDVNQENWAGARMIGNWAAGPPILKAVKAYQAAPDGSFSKLVYSARWSDPTQGSGRQLIVEARFPGIEPGRLQVRLQFSKPMDITSAPRATFSRVAPLEGLTFVAADGTQGWQKTDYLNDTWIGQVVIPQDSNHVEAWRLAVSASDTVSLKLDADPNTIASYGVGTGRWSNYEGQEGSDSQGGADTKHSLAPTLRGDGLSILVAAPSGGERLVGGEVYTVEWTIPKESGFFPIQQRLWLSTDSGTSFEPMSEDIQGNTEKLQIVLPRIATTRARIRVVALEGAFNNVIFGVSETDFTIAGNIGSGAEISFISSERLDLSWSDVPSEEMPTGVSGSSRLAINLRLINRGATAILNPFLRVVDLSRGNVLLTRDSRSRPSDGARQSIDVGEDSLLGPGETGQVRLIIGLVNRKKFNLSVELYGVPAQGLIGPGDPVRVWSGKPRNK